MKTFLFGLAALSVALPAAAQPAGQLSAQLSGAAERPGPGDPDGAGRATFTFNAGQVCYEVAVDRIAPATMAHIHKGAAAASGPPVVTLQAPGPDGKAKGCATADAAVLNDIQQTPGAYYLNVHNGEFPAGAVRGQLSR